MEFKLRQRREDGAEAGYSAAGAGDVNGDGFADLIVGAPSTAATGTRRGEAYLVFGGRTLGGMRVPAAWLERHGPGLV